MTIFGILTVFKSLLLNSLSLASIYTLDLIFVPLLAGKEDRWLHRNFGSLYTVFWLLPVIGISLYLNVREYLVPCALAHSNSETIEYLFKLNCEEDISTATWEEQCAVCWGFYRVSIIQDCP